MTPESIKKEIIHFQNNNKAMAVLPSAKNRAEDIVATLDLPVCQAVILILGGVEGLDERHMSQLTQLFGRGIVRAAREANAIIVDKAAKTGVMPLLGEGLASYGYQSGLIGVAPKNKISYSENQATGVPLEPNHTHFVLTEGNEWGSEMPMLFHVVRALTHPAAIAAAREEKTLSAREEKMGKVPVDATTGPVPALAILAGGEVQARAEVLRATRMKLPLIVIEGSGGLADEIATARHRHEKRAGDPVMAEILAEAEIHLYSLRSPARGIERLIARELGVDKVLRQAWETFADYDLNATLQQKRYDSIQKAILLVGLAGTGLALFQQVYAPKIADTGNLQPLVWNMLDENGRLHITPITGWWLLRHVLILLPILLLVLLAAFSRFKQGTKWLALRAGADAIQREIYRYRARAHYYQEKAEQLLSDRLADITRRTMQTDVNASSLQPYNKEKGFPPVRYATSSRDDGFSYLTPDRYVEWRLQEQLNFFKHKTIALEGQLKRIYWLIYVVGGLGAFLAAINQQVWIAFSTSLVGALGALLAYRQTEHTLLRYNQAVTDLANIKVWWYALTAEEQTQQTFIDSMIEHTEKVLQYAMDNGLPQLRDVLADLQPKPEMVQEEEQPEPGEFRGPGSYQGAPLSHEILSGDSFSSTLIGNGFVLTDSFPEAESILALSNPDNPAPAFSGNGLHGSNGTSSNGVNGSNGTSSNGLNGSNNLNGNHAHHEENSREAEANTLSVP